AWRRCTPAVREEVGWTRRRRVQGLAGRNGTCVEKYLGGIAGFGSTGRGEHSSVLPVGTTAGMESQSRRDEAGTGGAADRLSGMLRSGRQASADLVTPDDRGSCASRWCPHNPSGLTQSSCGGVGRGAHAASPAVLSGGGSASNCRACIRHKKYPSGGQDCRTRQPVRHAREETGLVRLLH